MNDNQIRTETYLRVVMLTMKCAIAACVDGTPTVNQIRLEMALTIGKRLLADLNECRSDGEANGEANNENT